MIHLAAAHAFLSMLVPARVPNQSVLGLLRAYPSGQIQSIHGGLFKKKATLTLLESTELHWVSLFQTLFLVVTPKV